MPLSPQEKHCIDLALPVFDDLYGSSWHRDSDVTIADTDNTNKSPECIVSNGILDVAIEVKTITGDAILQAYKSAIRSLKRTLAPSCGGYYYLYPAVDLRLPIDGKLRRWLKSEIERVAPTLGPNERGSLRIPRESHVSMSSATGPGFIWCCHNDTENWVRAISGSLTGQFILVDQGSYEHTFVTDEALAQFHAAILGACRRCTELGDGRLSWYEEWVLQCSDGSQDESGVWVISATEAREVQGSVSQAVELVLVKALEKFWKRWASKHVILLDRDEGMCTEARVSEAISWFTTEELRDIDLVLLTDKDDVSVVWDRSAPQRAHISQKGTGSHF